MNSGTKCKDWDQIRSKNAGDPEPASAWPLIVLSTSTRDGMIITPNQTCCRGKRTIKGCELLSAILPSLCWQNEIRTDILGYVVVQVENRHRRYRRVLGTLHVRTGDIDIRELDMLNLFWEPGITDIQKSRNLFHGDLLTATVMKCTHS